MKVYAKASLRSPLLVGIVKSRLYLPTRWSSWSPEELRGVVAHELAHRDNRDIWVLIFQAIATALFCINPLIWLLNRRLTFLRELRCDEAVLRETNLTPAEYGRLLFGFVDRRPALSALYFNERGTALKKRLEHVLNFTENNVKRSKWQLAIPILIGLAIVPFSIREAYTQSSPDADSSKVLEFFMVEVKPKVLHSVKFVHPEEAIRDSLEGKVFLKFIVNVDGSVSDVRVLRGPEVFHQAAIDAISQYRFKPAEHNGKPVAVWMTQPVMFQLPKQQTTPPASGDADSSKVLAFYMVEVKPKVLHAVKPVHPEEAIRDSLEGKVFLKFIVNVDGSVSDVRVLKGPEIFRQAAIDAALQFQFKPAEHNGKPVAVWMTQPISFRLPKQQSTPPASGDADSSKVLEFFMVEVKPKVLHSVKFVHPEEAIRDSLEGKVFLKFRVNVDGSVSDVRVLRGPEVFHQAAIDGISQFRFKPAEHNGKPVAVWMTQPVNFQLPKQQTRQAPRSSRYVPPTASGQISLKKNFSSEVRPIFKVEVKPKLLHEVLPVYPKEALENKVEGRVPLRYVVNVDSSVSGVKVLKSSGTIDRKDFQQAAIDAVSQFRYKPAEHNGKPVAVWIIRMIRFRLPKE